MMRRVNNYIATNCYKVLPLVYDDSLSYYETLCKLVNKLNETIDELNNVDIDNILSNVDKHIEQELSNLYKRLTNVENTVHGVMDNVDNALELYHKQVIGEMSATKAELTSFVNVQLLTIRKYIDSQDNNILSELRYQIELLKNSIPELTTVYVKSPYTGKIITIQQAVDELWNNLRVYALTADEYDEQQFTAIEYDNFSLTTYQYDYYAKEFIWKNPNFYMFSPFTGEFVFYQDVIKKLITLHRNNALTASEYDNLNLTSNTYDAKKISGYNYDWNGKTLL